MTSIHQFWETPWQNLRMTLVSKKNKWNSSKSTLWNLKHHFINKLHMQKYLHLKCRCHDPTLGSRPKQRLTKMWTKNEARESHFMLLGVWESVREWTSTLPSELPFWELPIWFPTPKSPKSPRRFPCVHVECYIPLESSWRGLQLYFKPHLNQRFAHKVMGVQSCKSLNFGNFGSPRTKWHLGVGPVARHR